MPQTPLASVVSHWHKLFENLEVSAKDYYAAVETALASRKIPGLKSSRVRWSEGGLLSPDREYLRVEGDRHRFDMCAAPFGTGYFFSSWVTKRAARFVPLYFLGFVALVWGIWKTLTFCLGWLSAASYDFQAFFAPFRFLLSPFVLIPISGFILLWLVALSARAGAVDPEAAVLAVPFLAWVYEKLFAPETYYRADTMLMFQSAVQSAMLEAIDGQTTQKGLRGLTEAERKPVFHKLM